MSSLSLSNALILSPTEVICSILSSCSTSFFSALFACRSLDFGDDYVELIDQALNVQNARMVEFEKVVQLVDEFIELLRDPASVSVTGAYHCSRGTV